MPDVPAGRQLQTILDDAVGLWLDLILKPASMDAGCVWLCSVKFLKKHLSIFKVLNIDDSQK